MYVTVVVVSVRLLGLSVSCLLIAYRFCVYSITHRCYGKYEGYASAQWCGGQHLDALLPP